MLNLPVAKTNNVQTMSSRDLAVLCLGDKKDSHSNFVIKMNKVLSEVDVLNFQDTYFDSQNRKRLFYNLPEREACLMAMSYSYELQAKVYDAWQELKAPTPLTHEQQVLMIATQLIETTKQKDIALIEVDRLQGVCNTITAQFAPGLTAPKFCKQLQGVNTQQVNNVLIELGMLTRKKDGVIPTSYSRDRYFAEKHETHNKKLRSHSALTLVGAKWLYRAYLSNKLPMKASWNGSFIHMIFEG